MAFSYPEYKIPNFVGGIDESVDISLIKPNEAKTAQNVDISNGALRSKKDSVKYLSAALGTPIITLMAYYNKTSNILMCSGNDGGIYTVNINSFALSKDGFTNTDFDFVNFQVGDKPVVIVTNGVDTPYVCDGTSWRKILNRRKVYNDDGSLKGYNDANEVFHATETDITTYAPKGKYLELHYDRLWLAGDTDNPDRVYFTTADVNGFDIDDWTYPTEEAEANQHGGFIDCSSWDGGKIIGLKVIFDDVLIFKNKTIYKTFGTYPGNYQKVELFSSEGGIADRSIVKAHNKAYFVASEGIFVYDGTNVLPISQKLQNTWKTLNKDYLYKSVGVFYENKYILAVPEGNSTVNNLIIEFNTDTNAYTLVRGITVNSFLEYNNELLFADNIGYINKYENSGSMSNAVYETGLTDLGYINATKNTQNLYFVGSGNGDIKITCITDRKPEGTVKIITLTNTEKPYIKKLKARGRLIGVKIENVNGSSFNIKNFKIQLEIDFD